LLNTKGIIRPKIISAHRSCHEQLVEIFHRFDSMKHSTVAPKAFAKQGLYLLATILKSPLATQTTIAIIETFTKIRTLRMKVSRHKKRTTRKKYYLCIQKLSK